MVMKTTKNNPTPPVKKDPPGGWKKFIKDMFSHSLANENNYYTDLNDMDDARNWAEGMRKLVDEKEIVIEQRNTRVWMKIQVVESPGEKIHPSCNCGK